MPWNFYGRSRELLEVGRILDRRRWFFAKLTGRRRIGKTTLIQQAIKHDRPVFYVQIPDSGMAGVLSSVADAWEAFAIPVERFPRPTDLSTSRPWPGASGRWQGRVTS